MKNTSKTTFQYCTNYMQNVDIILITEITSTIQTLEGSTQLHTNNMSHIYILSVDKP